MSRILLIRPPAVPLDVGFIGKGRIGKMIDMCSPKGLPLGILSISSYLKKYTKHEDHVDMTKTDEFDERYLENKFVEFHNKSEFSKIKKVI